MEYIEDGITWVLPEDYSMTELLRISLMPKAQRLATLKQIATPLGN
jgi:hypothetical protein